MEDYLKAFDNVIGYDDIKNELMPICDMFHNPEKYAKLGVVMPSAAVLEGLPGYGKTLMCKCFIEACGVPYFVCRKDKANGDFINYMKKCFDDAVEKAPAIVFLDDMDKFANDDQDHKNSEEYVAVQACIDNVKGKNVFVIATTNEVFNLPDSLLRAGRFDIRFEMSGLNKDDQMKLIEHFLSNKPVAKDLSIEHIWQILGNNVSCAELEKIINDTAIKVAFKQKSVIEYKDIVDACLRHHFCVIDEHIDEITDQHRVTACHEAGHAIVSEILDPNSVGLVSIQAYRGSTAGVTEFVFDEYEQKTHIAKEQRIIALLAGKAASEIVLNQKDMGSWHDIYKAKKMIVRLRDDDCVYGFDCAVDTDSSSEQLNRADRTLNAELDRFYAEAKKIVFEHRDFLDAVVNALLEKKTIFAEDIQAIKKELKLA